MNISQIFIRRPIATSLIMLGIALFGVLAYRGLPVSDQVVERIYKRAKASDHTLSEAEILECVDSAVS